MPFHIRRDYSYRFGCGNMMPCPSLDLMSNYIRTGLNWPYFFFLWRIITIPMGRVNFLSTSLKGIHLLWKEIADIAIQFIDHHLQLANPESAAGTAGAIDGRVDTDESYDQIQFFNILRKIQKSYYFEMFPYPLSSAWRMNCFTSASVTFFRMFMYSIASVMRVKTSSASRYPLLSTSQARKTLQTASLRSSSFFQSIDIIMTNSKAIWHRQRGKINDSYVQSMMTLNHFQQQFASILDFTVWQFTQTISVSWQLSTQKGMQQHTPVTMNRTKHQIQVTPPVAFLVILLVSLLQSGQLTFTAKF